MSDDKRKTCRLQGRFSDGASRKEKSNPRKNNSTGSTKGKESKILQAAEGYTVIYDQDANIPFEQFDEKIKPVEISDRGEHILSITENGKSNIIFEPDFIPKDEADEFFTIIRTSTHWYDKDIVIHGQAVPQPRQVAWFGPYPYAYSGAVLEPAEMPTTVMKIKSRIEEYLKAYQKDVELNSVLLNHYRDGKDSVAWHSDDELSLGVSPTIASVSLGETRKFEMKIKPKAKENAETLLAPACFVNLTNGSLVIMDGCMQRDWKHQIPKEYHDRGPRVNLTFRTVHPINKIPRQVPSNNLSSKSSENLNTSTTSKTMENKNIFDNTNFPPLSSECSETESSHITKIENTVETSGICPRHSPLQDEQDPYLEDTYTEAEDENYDIVENGTTFVGADAAICDTRDIPFLTEVTRGEVTSNENNCDNSHSTEEAENIVPAEGTYTPHEVKSELNANAPDFIPKCQALPSEPASQSTISTLKKMSMVELAQLFVDKKVAADQLVLFSSTLTEKIDQRWGQFSERDHHELQVLFDLNDGNQTDRNQKIIISRLCSMILNNVQRQQIWKNNPVHYRSQQNRDTYYDSRSARGSYRGSYRRRGGYKD